MSQAQSWQIWDLDLGGPGGTPRPTLSNAVKVLEHDKTLAGTIWYDEFLDTILTGSPAREWTDTDDLNLTVYIQDQIGLATLKKFDVRDAVTQYAHRRPRHVVKDWLAGLVWDGEPRVDHAFEDHWGVECGESQPCEYVRTISHNFFVGLIARVMQPGCQLDTMVVFEGAQGTGKTSALRVLGGDHYALAHESVTSKDFFQALRGKWLIEIGELDAFSRADRTRVKTVISTPTDRYRSSFGHRTQDHPRQCMFAGTTNADDWGNDETGLRRFWPARCGAINLVTLTAARDQLFAEALVLYGDGDGWWQVPSVIADIHADRQQVHPWQEFIGPWLIGRAEVSIAEVLTDCLKKDPGDLTMADHHAAGRCLRLLGWEKSKTRKGRNTRKLWHPSDEGEQGATRGNTI